MATNQQMDSDPAAASAAGAAVDEKLYSRQLYVMGHEAQRRMMASRAVLVGVSGLGAEVAKNIVLAGIAGVTLVDPCPATSYDLGGNFYLGEGDVGGTRGRAEACAGRLAELNEYVKVDVAGDVKSLADEEALLGLVAGASVVVVTVPLPTALLTRLDERCRGSGVCFIYSLSTGVFGQVFCDFGEAFTVTDKDGEFPDAKSAPCLFFAGRGTVGMPTKIRYGEGARPPDTGHGWRPPGGVDEALDKSNRWCFVRELGADFASREMPPRCDNDTPCQQ